MIRDDRITRMRCLINSILFPYRALFKHLGFGSFIMSMEEERMTRVARHCVGRVLDIGCGPHNKLIRHVYPNGIRIDFFPYDGAEFLHDDPTHLPFEDGSFGTITLNAVAGYIARHLRKKELREFARILKPKGRIVMTEGEPIMQFIHHKWVYFLDKVFRTNIDVDTKRGMVEDEEYCMPHREILRLFGESALTHIKTEKFQWGVNNVFVAEKR